ncbi:MAG: hypothetical protein WCX70_00075 [Candidatus Paceibacterota bacterium]|jgi:thiol-disulfide isomerase/thioredoxin
MIKKQVVKISLLVFFFLTFFLNGNFAQAQSKASIYFFWGFGCPHCAKEKEFLSDLALKHPNLQIKSYEIYFNRKNQILLEKVVDKFEIDSLGVPLTIIGDEVLIGFSEGVSENLIEEKVARCLTVTCPDKMSTLLSVEFQINPISQPLIIEEEESMAQNSADDSSFLEKEESEENSATTTITSTSTLASTSPLDGLKVPFLGPLDLRGYSLPLLALILGFLDGFNPCAMWALIFLISLLLGMENRRRMWLLGLTFIATSALVYFIFMAAWLNLIIFLGFIIWIRLLIGLIALLGGGYNLQDFFKNKSGTCKISENKNQDNILEKLKASVQEKNFWVALGGIIVLAFAVNLVELVCSAGLPAVFTQVLALNNLVVWQYYAYILLYVFFFMLDDLMVFFVSMATLRLTGLTTKYSRISRLVGGILMVIIGLFLIFKPEWLLFG